MGLDIPFPIGLLVSGIGFGWAFDSFSDRDLPPFACLNVNLRERCCWSLRQLG